MNLSSYSQTIISNYLTGADFPASPTSVRFTLSSTDPTISLTPVGDIVAFTPIVNSGTLTNSDVITVPNVSGSVSFAAIVDENNNVLIGGALQIPRVFAAGDTFSLDANKLEVSMGGVYGNDFRDYFLDWIIGNTPPSAPSSLFLQLSRGETFNPPHTTDNYEKQPLTLTPATPISGQGLKHENTDNILFPASHTNSWGTITHIFVTDQNDAELIKVALSTPKHVDIGESVGFADNSFDFIIG